MRSLAWGSLGLNDKPGVKVGAKLCVLLCANGSRRIGRQRLMVVVVV